tara:strand:- start:472 stop:906 length:435 start_codon:yes stop_codon:yes gene_type:complete
MATGQYKKQNLLPSDLDVTVVRAAAAPTTSYVASTEIDCRGFREVDFFVHVVAYGAMTKLTVKPETGQALSSSTVQYATYLAESIEDGVATTHEYEVELNDPTPANDVVYKVTLPVEGRFVRVQLKVDDAGSSPSVAVYAQRRV